MMRQRHNKTRRFLRQEGGATAVEFAIVVSPILMILIGIVDFSIVGWRTAKLDHATSQLHSAVRQNMTNGGNYRRVFCDAAGALINCDHDQLSVRVEPLSSISTGVISDGYSVVDDQPFVVQTHYRHVYMTPFMNQLMAERLVETQLVLYGARD